MDPPGGPTAAAGWYPDPSGSSSLRFWDGTRWTDALSAAVPPAHPGIAHDDTRGWALAAHLSALLAVFVVGLSFIGPLAVYLVKKDDPFVRRHASEALNFNLSCLIYALVLGFVTIVLVFVLVGFFLIPLLIALAIAWIVFICIAAAKAGQGEEYSYQLTIRFIS